MAEVEVVKPYRVGYDGQLRVVGSTVDEDDAIVNDLVKAGFVALKNEKPKAAPPKRQAAPKAAQAQGKASGGRQSGK